MPDHDEIQLNTDETPPEEPKAEETPPEETPPERPEWLLDKFKTVEDQAQAYPELEKVIGKPKPAPAAVGDKLDLNAIRAEMADNEGKLSDATYDVLDAHGISREDFDGYIEGQAALADRGRGELEELAGGKEGLDAVMKWAEEGISQGEQVAFNNAAAANDIPTLKLLLRGIVTAYTEAMGSEPNLVTGQAMPRQTGAKPYRSRAEMVADIQNPKYDSDEAYRKDVEARIGATDF
jgi:hypothetical protein